MILADEPSGNLDTHNAVESTQLFFKLRSEFNQTFIIVTHNTELAEMADRKLTIEDWSFSFMNTTFSKVNIRFII